MSGGRVALVTGANSGIGRAIALRLGSQGLRVAVNYLVNPADAEQAVAEIAAAGGEGLAVQADITQPEQVAAMTDTLTRRWGDIDILVNNAGIQQVVPFLEMSIADWEKMVSVHLHGTFLCCREVAPQMARRRKGYIVNIASQIGQIGRGGMVHYSAAKAGIIGLTRALAQELGPLGVLVNTVAPGPVAVGPPLLDPAVRQAYMDRLPVRRFGTGEEVAAAVWFLVSGEADYFCGQTLGPNGGEVML